MFFVAADILFFSVCFFFSFFRSSFFSSSPVCFFRGHFCCLSFFSLALALLLLLSCSCREFNLCASFLVDMSFLNFIFSPNLSLVTRVVLAPLVPCSFCFFLWKCLFSILFFLPIDHLSPVWFLFSFPLSLSLGLGFANFLRFISVLLT